MKNLNLWDKVRTPDPEYTKQFNRGGGFKGTATNTQYLIQMATEQWGPNGVGWGLEITNEDYVGGAYINDKDKTIIHVVRGFVWYMFNDERKETSPQFGQTTFVGSNKNGTFTDEEAPKKSVSDLMAKCLSLLGFSADIFLGRWDDNKYLNDVKARFKEQPKSDKSKKVSSDHWEKRFEAESEQTLDGVLAWRKTNGDDIRATIANEKEAKKLKSYLDDYEKEYAAPAKEDREAVDKWLKWISEFSWATLGRFNNSYETILKPSLDDFTEDHQKELIAAHENMVKKLTEAQQGE